ncbi:acyloxyacyl hydrolase [Rhodobacteraceae bacterium KMM 6894]|nr:acyloxyacyl hydrolase [Rhodobacteraceae bacterium KMM 6894]
MSDLAFITDGTAAVVGVVLGLINMGVNHCPNEGCLAKNEVQSFNSLSVGEVVFQEKTIGEEIFFRRQTGKARGPFQFTYGASVTDEGGMWVGLGSTTTYTTPNKRFYAQFHTMPGLYSKGGEVGLGGAIQFRSGVEVGYQNRQGVRAGLSIDHRSNAGIYSNNPGLETVQFRVSIPTR